MNQHKTRLRLYPIILKFPNDFKVNKLYIGCVFTHDEEGTTKPQKLILNIKI